MLSCREEKRLSTLLAVQNSLPFTLMVKVEKEVHESKESFGSSFIDSLKLHTNACLHIIAPMNVNPIVLFRFGVEGFWME